MNMDSIYSLPTDDIPNKPYELQIIDNIFKQENVKQVKSVVSVLKDVLIAGMLFLVLSLPFISEKLNYSTNAFYNLLLKTAIFVFLFFIITNYYLIKTN